MGLCNFLFRKGGLEYEQAKSDTKKGSFGGREGQKGCEEGVVQSVLLVRVFVVADTTVFFYEQHTNGVRRGFVLDSTGRKLQYGLFVGVHTNKIYFHYYERNTKTLSTYPYYVVRVSKFRVLFPFTQMLQATSLSLCFFFFLSFFLLTIHKGKRVELVFF